MPKITRKRPRALPFANIASVNKNATFEESGTRLYRDANTADVFFVVTTKEGSTERVPAHKALLAAASDVFYAMFYGPIKEEGDIKIEDTVGSILEEFLQFFYLGSPILTMNNVSGVMHLSHKYNVKGCFKTCIEFIKYHLSHRNVCTGLGAALLYDLRELRELCDEKISKFTHVVLNSTSFLKCEKPVLKHILSLDILSCSEKLVFDACMAWVKHTSEIDDVDGGVIETYLGDAFYDIRFASMKVHEFAALIDVYGDLFSEDECKEIVQMIGLPRYQPKKFSKKLREKFPRPVLLQINNMKNFEN